MLVTSLSVSAAESVWILKIQGAIGPATADYVVRGLEDADEQGAHAVILAMDTPGGLDRAMRDIIQAIIASPIPVIGYVEPSGARAASAGTYILYASHISAMAPATNLGAATPVQIGAPGMPSSPDEPDPDSPSAEKSKQPSTAMERKMINDAVAYIRGLAELRGRNAEWAERAVTDAATLTAEQAREKNVVDLVASNTSELLKLINGRVVTTEAGKVTLATTDAEVSLHEPDWRYEFLSIITDPNVAYILLLIGIYGLIFEFSNPGMGGPGIIGAICLITALYALQVLPVSYSALALIVLGIGLMTAEAFSPSFGVLGVGGIIAFVVGSIMLMDTKLPAFQIAWPIILALTAVSAGLLILVLGMLLRYRRGPTVSGVSILVGDVAQVITGQGEQLIVLVQGERWQAICDQPLQKGDYVRVLAVDGLKLSVTPMDNNSRE
ncbi:nodulation protein NfeD [Porticoccaceae bacterium LTM1]|nr:nodulation protein NfeD [Porticoccaceae bacterium LTM1]